MNMDRTAAQVLDDALALPDAQRKRVADRIYESLNGDSQDVIDEAWVVECERRSAAMDSSGAKPLNWDDTLQRLRDKYPDNLA